MSITCNYCIDPPKNCNHHCKGVDCNNYESCHRKLSAIIRITTKCTQECRHCCFACSPTQSQMMSIETATQINQFLVKHQFYRINIMGGEFFCHPQWDTIISILCQNISHIRITTNGDWGHIPAVQEKIIHLSNQFPLYFAISKDKYHTNQYVRQTETFCRDHAIPYQMANGEVDNDETIVPVKKGYFYAGFMAGISKFCSKYPYEILIDEQGFIAKCPMGLWKYDNVTEYLQIDPTDFYDRFKQIHKSFRCVMACNDCVRLYDQIGQKFEIEVLHSN